MMRRVLSEKASRMVRWSFESVARSTLAVASSSTMMRESLTRARASETSERSPTELRNESRVSEGRKGRADERLQVVTLVFDAHVEGEATRRGSGS